ncbi:MAG: hypothetical protein EA377_11895 [Phycisphaerales bacterium]|nr:MAG: hypothetical protein EA377_11895 [Phycisphaerales bacterium]
MPRSLPWFVLGIAAGCILPTAGFLFGAASTAQPADLIQARQVEIVDELGTRLMVLGASQTGGAVSVRDQLGRTMLLLGAGPEGGIVALNRVEDQRRAANLRATGQGAALELYDDRQNRTIHVQSDRKHTNIELRRAESPGERIRLDFSQRDAATLRLIRGEQDLLRLGVHSLNSGMVESFHVSGDRLVVLSTTSDQQGQMATFAPGDNPLVHLTATPDHVGQLYTFGPDRRPWIALASHPTGPSLRLFNPEGHPVVALESDEDGAGEIRMWSKDGPGHVIRAEDR